MLAFVLDENVPRRIWRAIQRHNLASSETLDVVRVGEPADLPYSADDAAIAHVSEPHEWRDRVEYFPGTSS